MEPTPAPTATSTPKGKAKKDKLATPALRPAPSRKRRITGTPNTRAKKTTMPSNNPRVVTSPGDSNVASNNNNNVMLQQIKDYFDPKLNSINKTVENLTTSVEGVTTSVTNLTGQVNLNAEDIRKLKKQVDEMGKTGTASMKDEIKKIVTELHTEDKLKPNMAEVVKMGKDIEKLKARRTPQDASSPARTMEIDQRYWTSRRSLRFWPVPGTTTAEIWKNTGEFLYETLGIPEDEIAEDTVERVRRVCTGRRKPNRVSQEVVVLFANVEIRDMVYSYAPNLAPIQGKAGIRIEIPCHLLGKFKSLTRYGKTQREKEGDGYKWSTKFDDIEQTLTIDEKLPGASGWTRVGWEKIMDMQPRPLTRGRLESGISSASGSGAEDNDIEMIEERLPQSATLQKYKKKPREWGQKK